MRKMHRVRYGVVVAATLIGVVACQQVPDLDVETFSVEHLGYEEVLLLLQPYVYGDRPEAPGMLSVTEGAVTVRETPDNLARIARVLAERDVARPDIQLRFQLIEADGFTEADPRIADVTDELRSVFQFAGYRLAGEAMVTATHEAEVSQGLRTPDGVYLLYGVVRRLTGGGVQLVGIELSDPMGAGVLRTTVNVRAGQTLILGSSPRPGSTATLLLTVRAEESS